MVAMTGRKVVVWFYLSHILVVSLINIDGVSAALQNTDGVQLFFEK